ncbi:MAG: tRNA pseudouridine(55) synthase TruB [Brevinematales bacterium]|nr:tRNA pseudouridine(55) synthase TruB [Brevinematales bacterium]
MLNGILPVYKEKNFSSFDVIRYIKKILLKTEKRQKIGHAGTLDPFAEGVLPIIMGEATKAFNFLLESEKSYIAEIKFGASTDTDDLTGNIIETFDYIPSLKEIENVLPNFMGRIKQIPPLFSAVRINGKRAYEIARKNKELSLREREIFIYNLEVINYLNGILTLKIDCSSGTYIRSLARDIGKMLKTGGYLVSLLRTKSSFIELKDCINLRDINAENIFKFILPISRVIKYPEIHWDHDEILIKNGVKFKINEELADGKYKIVKNDKLLAIIEKRNKNFRYLRVFL